MSRESALTVSLNSRQRIMPIPALVPFMRGLVSIGIAVVIWELVCWGFGVPEYLLPAPSVMGQSLLRDWSLLMSHTAITFAETVLGFALAVTFGALAAILVTTSERIKDAVMPLIIAIQLVPKVAVAPLILIWFGYGMTSKVVIAFLIAVFPIVIAMATGLNMIERELIDLLKSLGASRRKIFLKAQIPNSLPHLFSGMRISITLAIIGAIVGEFVGGSSGLGYLIVIGTSELKTSLVFAAIFVLTAMGFGLYGLIGLAERLIIPWSASERDELLQATGA